MKKNINVLLITFLMIFSLPSFTIENSWSLDMEIGPVFASRNSIQVPNPGGTRFSLSNTFDISLKVYYRLRVNFLLGKRHQLCGLYAPLTLKANGTPDQALVFRTTTFLPGESVDAIYRFNSYRLTYRYLLVNRKKLQLWLGFTGKIRDAKILLSSENKEDDTTNLGFVPLLHLYLDWSLGEKIGLLFEVDALAAPGGQGRAEDVSLSFYHQLGEKSRLRIGYRFIEGGADVEEVYNFAFLNYIYAAIQICF